MRKRMFLNRRRNMKYGKVILFFFILSLLPLFSYGQEVNQDASINLNLKFPSGYIKVSNLYRDTSSRADTEFTERIDRIEDKGNVILGVKLNRLKFEGNFSYFTRDYDENEYSSLEYDETAGGFTVYYTPPPWKKTDLLLEYIHSEIDYESSPSRDGEYNQVMVGVRGQITPKITGIIKGGYQDRDYDLSSEKDFQSGVAEIGLLWDISDDTKLKLSCERKAVESTYMSNNFYKTNRFYTQFRQKLLGRFIFTCSFSYENNKYPEETAVGSETKKRKDDIYTVGVGLEYAFKEWWKARINYEYKERNSNLNSEDYTRNLICVTCSFLF
ncbi:MAG: hypothetical protein B6D55_07495 [Candidatus Omnitrophica bacterium 4484_70.2]|nr:MAG: hypothetical protein B6D55_07495 [Candidatus Omnitrophica bacterium 4484_70.2]